MFLHRVILTDDLLRAKMLVAHHLEDASLELEIDNMMIWQGSYQQVPMAVIYGEAEHSLRAVRRLGAKQIVYVGECTSSSSRYPLRSLVLVDEGDGTEMHSYMRSRALDDSIPVITKMNLSISYEPLAAFSVLTVTKNTETKEQMEEHERRSRLYAATHLAFEILETGKPKESRT